MVFGTWIGINHVWCSSHTLWLDITMYGLISVIGGMISDWYMWYDISNGHERLDTNSVWFQGHECVV